MMIIVYFLPIWFQAIKGVSAVDSGIRLLPLVLPMVVSSMLTGIIITKVGYYTPFMIGGVCLMSIGAGLLTTLEVDTPKAKWVGYQFLYGWGQGATFQAPNLAAQTVLPNRDVPIGTSLMFFSQLLGGAIFISVGQNVLNNRLLAELKGIDGFNASTIINSGATTLTQLPDSIRGTVLSAYNEALRRVFEVALILVCLTIFGALSLEWRSVKEKKNQPDKSQEEGNAEEKAKDVVDNDAETQVGRETDIEASQADLEKVSRPQTAEAEAEAEAGEVETASVPDPEKKETKP
jgi:hypothetical protein